MVLRQRPPSDGPSDHLALAIADPAAAFRTRYEAIAGGRVRSVELSELPNTLAIRFAIALSDVEAEAWEFVASLVSQRARNPVAQLQYSIWLATHGKTIADELATIWMGTANASELLALAAFLRRQESASAIGDRPDFERWASIQAWFMNGGTGCVNTAGGHLGSRPYAGADTLEDAMFPMSEVLPFSRFATIAIPAGR
jgi:hypothetical protein